MPGELGKIEDAFRDPKDKKKMWMYIGIGVAGLVLTYLIYKHMSSSASSAGTTVAPAPGAAAGTSTQPGYGPGYATGQNYAQIQSELSGIQSYLTSSQLNSTAGASGPSLTGSSAPAAAIGSNAATHAAAAVPTISQAGNPSPLAMTPSGSTLLSGPSPGDNQFYSSYGAPVTAQSILASNPAMGANAPAAAASWNAGNLALYNSFIANGGTRAQYSGWSGNPLPQGA